MAVAEQLRVAGQEIRPSQKKAIRVPVTLDLDGNNISLGVHVISGARTGRTLGLLSALHGGEWQSIEIIRRLVERLNPADMSGNVIGLPVGNPVALGQLTRNTPDESDNADLNRVFPGQFTWIAEQLASVIAKEVMAPADAMIDFHMGLWGATLVAVMHGTDFPDPKVVEASRAMAKAFGWPCIHESKVMAVFPGPRSSAGYFGGVLGRPCIASEIGGAGFDRALEESWLEANVKGVINVMKHLGILPGEPEVPKRYLVWEKRWRVNPTKGGYLRPAIQPDRLLGEVTKGELLGRVISPYTFEELERLESPGRGILFYTARDYPVRPGDWAFGVVDLEDSRTRWESA